ncbi:unnamed protein product, partial [Prorocentrum cordatum]
SFLLQALPPAGPSEAPPANAHALRGSGRAASAGAKTKSASAAGNNIIITEPCATDSVTPTSPFLSWLTSSDVQRGAPWRGDTRLPSAQKAAARRQHRAPAKKGVQLLGGGRRRLRVLHGSWSEFGTGPPPQTTQVAGRSRVQPKSIPASRARQPRRAP